MFNYANKHRVAQRARWCESAKSYTLKWYSSNLQELRILPKISSDGRLCRTSAFTAALWERDEKSLGECCPGTQGRTKEIIKGSGNRVHRVEGRSSCSVIKHALTVTLSNFRWANSSQISWQVVVYFRMFQKKKKIKLSFFLQQILFVFVSLECKQTFIFKCLTVDILQGKLIIKGTSNQTFLKIKTNTSSWTCGCSFFLCVKILPTMH